MDFKGITHVIENPMGHAPGYNYSLVGSVPKDMLEARKPTMSDIIGGRVASDGFAYVGRKWETVEDIFLEAQKNCATVTLCTSPGCACRKLF